MNKYAAVLVLFFTGYHLHAQDLNVRFSEVEKTTLREVHEEILGYNAGSYDVLRYKFSPFGDAVLFADHFSNENLMRSYAIEIFKKDLYKNNQIKHKIFYENAFVLDSGLIVLFSSFNPDKLENVLYAVRFQDGYLIDDPQEVAKIKTPNRFEKGTFTIQSFPKRHSFVIIGVEPYLKNSPEIYHIASFDPTLHSTFKQNLTIPFKENNYELEQIDMDENQRVFLLFRIILNRDQKLQKDLPNSDYYFSLLQLSETQNEDYLETVLKIEDKSVYNMLISLSAEPGKILMSGFYFDKKNQLKPKGIYFAVLDKDSTQPHTIKIQPFAEDFIPDFETESPFTEITDEEPRIDLIDLLKTPDGGYVLLSEYRLVNETCITDYRTAVINCNYNFYYNDIFVFRFDSLGSMQRKLRIPKKQFTRNDQGMYSSFAYGFIDNKLVLLYNDHPKNLKPRNPSNIIFMTDAKKSSLAAVTIDVQGNVTKDHLLINDKRKTWSKPRLFFSSPNQYICIFSEKGRFFQTLQISKNN